MPHLEPVTDEQASAEQLAFIEGAKQMLGRAPNAMRTLAHAPRVAQALLGLLVPTIRCELTGELDMRLKALLILKTSTLNGCAYCIGHNTTLGRSLGFDDELIEAIAGDYRGHEGFTDAEKAAIAWAECVTERTCRRNREVMGELKEHYSDAQIVEITMVSCYFNMWNRFTDSLEVELEEHGSVSKIRKSRTIDPGDYVAYMNSGWWSGTEETEAQTSSAQA